MTGTIELSGDQIGVPSKNGSWFDDCRDGFKSFSAELFADGGEFSPLFIFQPDSAWQFRPQYPVFGDEILISEPKLLINGAGDIGE